MGALSWINAETLQSSATRLPPHSTACTTMSVPRDVTYNTDITYSTAVHASGEQTECIHTGFSRSELPPDSSVWSVWIELQADWTTGVHAVHQATECTCKLVLLLARSWGGACFLISCPTLPVLGSCLCRGLPRFHLPHGISVATTDLVSCCLSLCLHMGHGSRVAEYWTHWQSFAVASLVNKISAGCEV